LHPPFYEVDATQKRTTTKNYLKTPMMMTLTKRMKKRSLTRTSWMS